MNLILPNQWCRFSVFYFIAIMFTSCEPESIVVQELANLNISTTIEGVAVTIEGHVLHFSSIDDIETVLSSPKIVEDGLSFTGEFVSAAEAYNKFITDDANDLISVDKNPHLVALVEVQGETYLEPVVADDGLKHIVNSDGVLAVDERFMKVDRNDLRFVSAEDFASQGLLAFVDGPSLIIKPLQTSSTSLSIAKRNVIEPVHDEFTGEGSRSNRNKDFRLTGNIESTESLIGPNRVIVRSKFFRKRFGIWWGVHANLTNYYDLRGTYISDVGGSTPYNVFSPVPIAKRAQNFPTEVVSSSIFRFGDQGGLWTVDGLYIATASEDGGSGSIRMEP